MSTNSQNFWKNLTKYLPETCIKIDVKNVLFAVTQVAKMFYPKADMDFPDENLSESEKLKKLYPEVKFGKNVLIGKIVILYFFVVLNFLVLGS